MPRRRPFVLCRYGISVDGEPLSISGQLEALRETQGRTVAYGRSREVADAGSVMIGPKGFEVDGTRFLSWSVGARLGVRQQADHDALAETISVQFVEDRGIRYTNFVAYPEQGIVAVDDRMSEIHLGSRGAIARFRSIIGTLIGADADVFLTVSPQDVDRALSRWELTAFNFVVRPVNPHPPSDLAAKFSDQMKEDGVGQLIGRAKPVQGARMRASGEGIIDAAVDLANAGYGQVAFRGFDGEVEAEIRKPKFHQDKERNIQAQTRPRELRIFVETDGLTEEQIAASVARAMLRFYG